MNSSSKGLRSLLVRVGIILLALEFLLLRHVWTTLQENDSTTMAKSLHDNGSTTYHSQRTPDGTFNGVPIYFQDLTRTAKTSSYQLPQSMIHCVGENYQYAHNPAAPQQRRRRQQQQENIQDWKYRSCHFQFLCLDMDAHEFVLYGTRPEDQQLQTWYHQTLKPNLWDLSQTYLGDYPPPPSSDTSKTNAGHLRNITVSLGGMNLKWTREGMDRLEWFPKILHTPPPKQFYTLPEEVVMVPFHSLAGWNPGHLVWDDFLPIYTLLHMFQWQPPQSSSSSSSSSLHDQTYQLLALRYMLPGSEGGLWSSCDAPNKKDDCAKMLNKFWPLMQTTYSRGSGSGSGSGYNYTPRLSTQLDFDLTLANGITHRQSNLVCARHGAAGLGALTDHGTRKLHGWLKEDYEISHNSGRGSVFWKFRQFCLHNLGLVEEPTKHHGGGLSSSVVSTTFRIVISIASSNVSNRNLDFSAQQRKLLELQNDLKTKHPNLNLEIQSVTLKDMTLQEQIKLVTETTIFVTGCGGGAVTATFLPKGATTIIFYHEAGGRVGMVPTGLPARLDWDLFNNLSYLHVHWLPSTTMNKPLDLDVFGEVIQDDLLKRFKVSPNSG